MKDIKYLGIPNICFSLTEKEDERENGYKKQRIDRGFDDSETWSLSDSIARFILPRLIRFKEINNGYPANLTEDGWNDILDKMIITFKLVIRDNGARIYSDKEQNDLNKGLDLFNNHLMDLWW